MHVGENPEIGLFITAEREGHITVYEPHFNANSTYHLYKGENGIHSNETLVKRGNYTGNRGIHVMTDVPVSIIVTFAHNRAESFLALPKSFTGSSYVASAFKPYSKTEFSEIFVINNAEKSSVTITSNGTSDTRLLDSFSSLQIALGYDVSGIKIESNTTLSVIAGTSCAHIPKSITGNCDFLVEQMIPTDAWVKEYIVPSIPPNERMLIRVQAMKIGDVCFFTRNGSTCKQIPYPSPLDFNTGPDPVVVKSNGLISVTLYGFKHGQFMTNVPGIKNFMNQYIFNVPYRYAYHYIAVVAPSSKLYGLTLDGFSINASKVIDVQYPYNHYNVVIFPIKDGRHRLVHNDSNVKYGAILYGHSYTTGYGLPLGIQKENAIENYDGNVCFNCDDMHHIELCDSVKRCQQHEICFLERVLKNDRHIYTSGCMEQEACLKESNTKDHYRCTECCVDSYCNHRGCGELGLPRRNLRGPLCFDCNYAFSPDDCDTLKLCDEGQVCRIEETKWGTSSNFKMGCAHASF